MRLAAGAVMGEPREKGEEEGERRCAGEVAVTNHKSLLQTGTTNLGRRPGIGVTSDEAENAPRLRVTCGEDSMESDHHSAARVETHTAEG